MNIKLGKYNQLEVVKTVDFGVYLNGGDDGEILLPTRYVPEGCKPGDMVNVFIYLDNEERLIATTLQPKVQVGEFACLEVAWVNEFGAFLDWGLMKDLFCPFREQKMKMLKGHKYMVHAHVDEDSYRIMASAKVERYLSKDMPPYQPGEEVEVMAWQRTDLGYKVIVGNKYSGLVYQKEIFQQLEPGMKLTAYVRQVREDGKIDLPAEGRHGQGGRLQLRTAAVHQGPRRIHTAQRQERCRGHLRSLRCEQENLQESRGRPLQAPPRAAR